MWMYSFGLVLVFVLVPLTFPDGQLPSRRWRPLARLAGTLLVAVTLSGAFVRPGMLSEQAWIPNPYAIQFPADWSGLSRLTDLLDLAILVASVAALVSLIVGWRSADEHVRRQILLVVVAIGVVTLSFVVDAVAANLLPAAYPTVKPLVELIPIVLPVAIAVAVLRRRLFGIEVLVSRAAVYGLLAVVLGLIYAVIVVVVGVALSTDTSVGQWLGVAVVALAFAPAREVLQRWVGRRLLGDRREPYAALARLSAVAGSGRSPDNVLTRLVESVGESLKASYVALSLRSDSGIESPVKPSGITCQTFSPSYLWPIAPVPSSSHGRLAWDVRPGPTDRLQGGRHRTPPAERGVFDLDDRHRLLTLTVAFELRARSSILMAGDTP